MSHLHTSYVPILINSLRSIRLSVLNVLLPVLLVQCQTKKPEPPEVAGFDPPIPPTMSYLAGPITFKLQALQDKINQELDPVLIGSETKDGRVKGIISFRVKRLTSVNVQYVDHQVKLSAPLQMWLTKPFSKDTTPPKKPFCSLDVRFKSTISVTPNWRLACQTKFTDYKWIKKPQIRLLGGEISLEKLARNILDKHRTAIELAIDSAVYNELRLDNLVKPIWQDIQKPLLISRPYGLWLVPKPVSITAGPISGNSQQLTVPLRIALGTETDLKPRPPVLAKMPLPRLLTREQLPQTSDLNLMSFIPYADINRMLALTVNNQRKKMVMGTLTLKHVSVSAGNHALLIKADLGGLIHKTVYVQGHPTFDTLTNVLKIDNLNFNTEAGDNVVAQKDDTAWHNALRTLLAGVLVVRLGDDIAKLPQLINNAFEGAGVGKKTDLGIQSFRFTPQRIAICPDGIQALIKVKSTVKLTINRL